MRLLLPLAALILFVSSGSGQVPTEGPGSVPAPLLKSGDRVALLGGTFIERMQSTAALETEMQCRRPDWRLSVRNLGWSGDDVHGIARKVFKGPEDGFNRLMTDMDTVDPTVVLIAYGFSEASDGQAAVDRFKPGLVRLVKEMAAKDRRVILMTPIAMPGYRVAGYGDWMNRCRKIVAEVAAQTDADLLSVDWTPESGELTEDRLLPNQTGYESFAKQVSDALVGGEPCESVAGDLRDRIVDKNQLFFHRYRPQNETYLFLFRKHEQGNNAVEIPQFDPLIKAADAEIWKLAAGQ